MASHFTKIIVFLFLSLSIGISQGFTKAKSPAQKARESQRVVVGKVAGSDLASITDMFGDKMTVNMLKFTVDETLKGPAEPTLEVIAKPSSQFHTGEELVLFLNETPEGLAPFDNDLGVIRIHNGVSHMKNNSMSLDAIKEEIRRAK